MFFISKLLLKNIDTEKMVSLKRTFTWSLFLMLLLTTLNTDSQKIERQEEINNFEQKVDNQLKPKPEAVNESRIVLLLN